MDAIEHLMRQHHEAAGRLRVGPPTRLAFVVCSYDTAFESVADQIEEKIRQLTAAYSIEESIQWSLWVVDDLPAQRGFGDAVREGFRRADVRLRLTASLRCVSMVSRAPRKGGLKGRALIDGFSAALRWQPDVVIYLNLNLKVDAQMSALCVEAVAHGQADVAVGSRFSGDGGIVIGAGPLGRLKSRVFSRMARTALPSLGAYVDTNAPVKVFSAAAAAHLVRHARLDDVTLDCEWLLLVQSAGFRMARFPIAWIQRPGSRPPWHMVALTLRDVWRLRQRWIAGDFPRRDT